MHAILDCVGRGGGGGLGIRGHLGPSTERWGPWIQTCRGPFNIQTTSLQSEQSEQSHFPPRASLSDQPTFQRFCPLGLILPHAKTTHYCARTRTCTTSIPFLYKDKSNTDDHLAPPRVARSAPERARRRHVATRRVLASRQRQREHRLVVHRLLEVHLVTLLLVQRSQSIAHLQRGCRECEALVKVL